ncbi:phage tail terminator-like protein [Aureimonas sp. ME7]|uniref:phage tail terminator-like protein n=1 Tax=Aureimonas sp. ME7 TaxID=2744252 RepID=UPI0015FB9067|nr:phage tail terminator-like protein [Aureimonas sp. ME7]
MAALTVVQIVEARLRAGFDRCPIYVENSTLGTPSGGGPWILVDFPWSRSEWVSADEFWEDGGFRVLLAIEAGAGAHDGRAWLDEIASLFRGVEVGGVQFFAPQSASTGDQSDRGVHFRLALTVPYQFIIEG